MGPALAPKHATDDLAWAQPWSPRMLLMFLHGPSPGHPECYKWSCMGPALVTQNATNGLAWAQCCPPQHATDVIAWAQPWPPSILPMVLHGPALAPKCATDVLAWAQCWPQCMLLKVLHGPSAAPHSVLRMILHRSSPGH